MSDDPKNSGNFFCGQMRPHFSLFWGKTDVEDFVSKMKKTIQTGINESCTREGSVLAIICEGIGDFFKCGGTMDT